MALSKYGEQAVNSRFVFRLHFVIIPGMVNIPGNVITRASRITFALLYLYSAGRWFINFFTGLQSGKTYSNFAIFFVIGFLILIHIIAAGRLFFHKVPGAWLASLTVSAVVFMLLRPTLISGLASLDRASIEITLIQAIGITGSLIFYLRETKIYPKKSS